MTANYKEENPPCPETSSPGVVIYLCIFPLFFKALHVHNKALLLCNQPREISRKTIGVVQQPGSITFREKAEQSSLLFCETLLLYPLSDCLCPTQLALHHSEQVW